MRSLLQRDPRRQNFLARGIEQERCATILTAAAYRRDQMTDESARHLRHEQHGRGASAQLSCTEAFERALRGTLADRCALFHFAPIANGAIPIVALHVVVLLCDDRAAERVHGAFVTA